MGCLNGGQGGSNLRIRVDRLGNETSVENSGLGILQSVLILHQVLLWLGSYQSQRPTVFHRSPVVLHPRTYELSAVKILRETNLR